jgi:hypothetical protein
LEGAAADQAVFTIQLSIPNRITFLAGFLGLGGPAALALLPSSLQLPEVFRLALGDLLPTFPSKLDSGGIFFLGQI